MNKFKDQLDRISAFLGDNAIGKFLRTRPHSYELEDGKIEGEYSSEASFSGLFQTAYGLGFDLTMVSRENVYKVENDRRQLLPGRCRERVEVFRYELAGRESTGEIAGFMRVLVSNMPDLQAMAWGISRVRFEAETLRWREVQVLYRDMTYTADDIRPISQDARVRLYVREGKLQFDYAIELFEIVNQETCERKPSAENLPVFVFSEL